MHQESKDTMHDDLLLLQQQQLAEVACVEGAGTGFSLNQTYANANSSFVTTHLQSREKKE